VSLSSGAPRGRRGAGNGTEPVTRPDRTDRRQDTWPQYATDPNRPPIDCPKGQELSHRVDKVMPGYAMFLSRWARYAGYNVVPGFIAEAEG
jgi:hypothetical protein